MNKNQFNPKRIPPVIFKTKDFLLSTWFSVLYFFIDCNTVSFFAMIANKVIKKTENNILKKRTSNEGTYAIGFNARLKTPIT